MKKILALILVITGLLCCIAGLSFAVRANGLISSGITYVDSEGNPVSQLSTNPVTAKVTVTNKTDSAKKPVLMVCSYLNKKINGMWYKEADSEIAVGASLEIELTFTPVTAGEGTVIKATVLDSLLALNTLSSPAQMLNSSTALDGIFVNGEYVESYAHDVDDYFVYVEGTSATVSAQVADGGSTAAVTQPQSVPGSSEIKVTAPDGTVRTINVSLYNKIEQPYSLLALSYMVDGVKYEVAGFDPDVLTYNVALPKNTFYATVVPEALASAEVVTMITDRNVFSEGKKIADDVVPYFLGNSYNHRSAREAYNNIIPIKNEKTTATITVSAPEGSRNYVINFTCQQPRLTEFKLGSGTYQETEKPFFISGAALNNDNGTAVGADRQTWTLGGISKPLVGASMISFASVTSGRDAKSWQKTNTSGEWCSFKADTGGTIYLITSSAITNTAYYNENNGWIKVTNATGSYTKIADGVSLKVNENKDAYCIYNIQWKTQADSYTLEGITNPSGLTVGVYANVYKKSFKADELVSIHHPGYTTMSNGVGEAAIVWDLPQN